MKRFFTLFCVVVLMLTLSACGLDEPTAPTNYHATFELYVNLEPTSKITSDVSYIIKSRSVLNRVIEETGITLSVEELEHMISVETSEGSKIITVCVTAQDGQLAMDIANALAKIGPELVNDLMESDVLKVLQSPVLTASSPRENLFSNHATFELYVVSQDNDYIDYNNLTVASQLIRDISVILKGEAVLNRVIEETGITLSVEELEHMISVETSEDSQIITVCVTAEEAQTAMDIAEALAKIGPERVAELMGSDVLKVLQSPVLTASSPWGNLFSKESESD